jgi:hypothetical protein
LSVVVPGGGEAREAEELADLTQLWHEADRGSSEANLAYHYLEHAKDVDAMSKLQYARKAASYLPQAKKGAISKYISMVLPQA